MNTQGLYPHQISAVEHLLPVLELHNAALDGSDAGTGKTFTACGIIRELELPTLVVAPKISLTAWKRVGDALGVGFCCKNWEMLRTGTTAYGSWQFPLPPVSERKVKLICTSCQCEVQVNRRIRCHAHPTGLHCVETQKVPHVYGRFNWYSGIGFIVFDEIHVANALDSLHSAMVEGAKRANIKTLGLSATATDSPLGFKALGYMLNLHAGPSSFYHWVKRHNVRRPVWGGLEFYGSDEKKREVMSRLHSEIFPSRGVRIRTSDISDFPSCKIDAELFDLEGSGKLSDLYARMEEAIEILNHVKLSDKAAEHPLVVLLRCAQEIELIKVPLFIALRDEAIEAGHSCVLFVNYRQTMDELLRRMKLAACIRGNQDPAERQHWIDQFQSNEEHTIVANTAAGGVSVSLHDLKGRPRLGVCSVHPSAVKMRQVFGRLARAGGLSPARYRMVLVAGTPEEKLHRRLAGKLNCMDALLDSDLTATNLPLCVGDLGTLLEEKHL